MILDEIAAKTRLRIEECKQQKSLEQVKEEALKLPVSKTFPFEQALKKQDINFICEVKKASPSKGVIAPHFHYLEIAKEYETAGASAISVLTEPYYFQGADKYLQEIANEVNIPVLRKDFTLDEYQIYEAKILGASAVLLICALLSEAELIRFRELADSLGLSCLVEAHDEAEIAKAIKAKARIIGVNNRNLKDFTVDVENSLRLRNLVPKDVIFVSESGMKTAADIDKLRAANVQAALIGETFMRAPDKVTALRELYGATGKVQVKICGIRRKEDVDYVNTFQPDYMGFIFAGSSRRYVNGFEAEQLAKIASPYVKKVGVFVDEQPAVIDNLVRNVPLDVVQLHGDEDEKTVQEIKRLTGVPVWKAVRVKTAQDIMRWRDSSADMLLFDTYVENNAGGTGKVFNWDLLKNVKRKFILAGGLNIKNVARAIRTCKPYGVDISSGVETDFVKDKEKIRNIMMTIRKVQ